MAWRPFRNIGLKCAALALGTLLWFTVSGHQIERRILVPISYTNVPDSFKITDSQVESVSVFVRGDDNRISTLVEGDIRVLVSLDDAQSGSNAIQLRSDDVIAPLGVQVFQIEPNAMTVSLERSSRMEVPVRATIEGTPVGGMTVGDVSITPSVVTVEGPESHFRTPITAVTQRVVVSGHGGTFTQDVEVSVADGELHVVQPRTVKVTVHIVTAGNARPAPASSPPPASGGH